MQCLNSFLAVLFAIILPATGFAWDKAEIDNYVESVRRCWDRPAVTIAIVEVNENDEITQAYANAYGRVDPTCDASNCTQVDQTVCQYDL